ncbi:MAG: hypothetical protein KAS32_13280, partial [Candidatus Peribacteraceae bacterium]|nr:hypothetical protein [Candidatus Peribacteraceae bacterium]
SEGYQTIHSRGSFSWCDIIAINSEHSLFIQCKAGKDTTIKAGFREYKNNIADIKLPPYHYPAFMCWRERDAWYELIGWDTDKELTLRSQFATPKGG